MSPLSSEHQYALSWFLGKNLEDNFRFTQYFDGIPIVSPGQGIFKPKGSTYVLSVKETLGGPYPDQKPIYMPDGSWLYAYHQQDESGDPVYDRDNLSSNRALMENIKDKIPVGVWIQTQKKGRDGTRYRIGIALPIAWCEGFFILSGSFPTGEIMENVAYPGELLSYILKSNQEQKVSSTDFFDPKNIVDERNKALRTIVQRQGQPAFRKKLLQAYGGKCPITKCDLVEALEVAHIIRYMGPSTNSIVNGLPLRGDTHTLWDLGLIAVDTSNMTVIMHPKLLETEYEKYNGLKLILPSDPNDAPAKAALDAHRDFCGF